MIKSDDKKLLKAKALIALTLSVCALVFVFFIGMTLTGEISSTALTTKTESVQKKFDIFSYFGRTYADVAESAEGASGFYKSSQYALLALKTAASVLVLAVVALTAAVSATKNILFLLGKGKCDSKLALASGLAYIFGALILFSLENFSMHYCFEKLFIRISADFSLAFSGVTVGGIIICGVLSAAVIFIDGVQNFTSVKSAIFSVCGIVALTALALFALLPAVGAEFSTENTDSNKLSAGLPALAGIASLSAKSESIYKEFPSLDGAVSFSVAASALSMIIVVLSVAAIVILSSSPKKIRLVFVSGMLVFLFGVAYLICSLVAVVMYGDVIESGLKLAFGSGDFSFGLEDVKLSLLMPVLTAAISLIYIINGFLMFRTKEDK